MKRIASYTIGSSLIAALLAATASFAPSDAAPQRAKPAPQNPNFPRTPAAVQPEPPAPVAPAAPEIVRPKLRSQATIDGDVVRLSDLIEGIDAANDVPMFRAPELGQIGTIQASRVAAAAVERGLPTPDTGDLTAIIVRRSGHIVPQDQLLDLVREALVRRYGLPPDTDLIPEKGTKTMIVEAQARRTPEIASFNFDNRLNRFEVSFVVPGSALTAKTPFRISGTLGETIRVPIVIRQLNKGDTIGQDDVAIETRKRSEFFGDGLIDPAKVAGQVTKHAMHVGDIVAVSDVSKADWVEKGALVTLIYETPGMSLATKGRATANGSDGDTVTIENLQSKRSVEGRVIGPGKVSVQVKSALATPAKTSLGDSGPTKTALVDAQN